MRFGRASVFLKHLNVFIKRLLPDELTAVIACELNVTTRLVEGYLPRNSQLKKQVEGAGVVD